MERVPMPQVPYGEDWEGWRAFWEYNRSRRFHALPEDKGIPVPRTGRHTWHSRKDNGKSGVIGNSRVLPHRYMDEGDKGAAHRRHIKRVERAQWLSEWQEDSNSEEPCDTAEWFAGWAFWWEDDATCGSPYCEVCE